MSGQPYRWCSDCGQAVTWHSGGFFHVANPLRRGPCRFGDGEIPARSVRRWRQGNSVTEVSMQRRCGEGWLLALSLLILAITLIVVFTTQARP